MTGWTAREAAEHLDPPLTEDEVRALITIFQVPAIGQRTGGRGRPADEYAQDAILHAHAIVIAARHGHLASPYVTPG
ncbi:hypothetical protein [Nonomuraea sp. NPDC050310]|uniref:hypothetical protein n=1 Tax=Nonomuraea sp. NPDC050310 TaxID=3154935 RepID=UPI0033F18418